MLGDVFVLGDIVVILGSVHAGHHVGEVRDLPSKVRALTLSFSSECSLKSLNLEETFALTQGFGQSVLDQTQGQLFALNMDAEAASRFLYILFESLSVSVQFLLVCRSDITEPLPVGLDATSVGISWSLPSLLHIRFLLVHVETVDGGTVSELGAGLAA